MTSTIQYRLIVRKTGNHNGLDWYYDYYQMCSISDFHFFTDSNTKEGMIRGLKRNFLV